MTPCLPSKVYLRSKDPLIEGSADLDSELADTVLARFSEVNFERVGNLSGFLMGIVRRVQQDGPGCTNRNLEDLPQPIRRRLFDLIDSV